MSATRTRKTSSKKTAQRRGRSGASTSSRRSKGARSTARKSAGASKRGASSGKSSAKSSAKSKSASASRSPIAQSIALLTEDHRKVDKMFRQAGRVKDDLERLRPIVEEACAALTEHSEIEEQYFYPVMQEAIKETDLIAEAYVEHGSLKELIAKLKQRGRGSEEQYAAMFTVLGEYVKHHVKEEEGEIFPKARRARADFQPLLDALRGREEGAARQKPARAARASEAQESGRSDTRGRQGRGRSSREAADGAGGREAMQGDIEQPRRGRRGSAREESGETEEAGLGRDQEGIEQEGSREANR